MQVRTQGVGREKEAVWVHVLLVVDGREHVWADMLAVLRTVQPWLDSGYAPCPMLPAGPEDHCVWGQRIPEQPYSIRQVRSAACCMRCCVLA